MSWLIPARNRVMAGIELSLHFTYFKENRWERLTDRYSARVNKRGSRFPGMLRIWKHACIPMFRGIKGVMPNQLLNASIAYEALFSAGTGCLPQQQSVPRLTLFGHAAALPAFWVCWLDEVQVWPKFPTQESVHSFAQLMAGELTLKLKNSTE